MRGGVNGLVAAKCIGRGRTQKYTRRCIFVWSKKCRLEFNGHISREQELAILVFTVKWQ
jgi:hypothetical protein